MTKFLNNTEKSVLKKSGTSTSSNTCNIDFNCWIPVIIFLQLIMKCTVIKECVWSHINFMFICERQDASLRNLEGLIDVYIKQTYFCFSQL